MMDRLQFLDKARQLAFEQCIDSSCMTDVEWEDIQAKIRSGKTTEQALYEKAKEILADAEMDIKIPS